MRTSNPVELLFGIFARHVRVQAVRAAKCACRSPDDECEELRELTKAVRVLREFAAKHGMSERVDAETEPVKEALKKRIAELESSPSWRAKLN